MSDLTGPDDAEDGEPLPGALMGSVTFPDDSSDESLFSTDEGWDADV